MAGCVGLGRLDHLTFKGNLRETRYGWLRLTPAYSVHLVAELQVREPSADAVVLDPFCGTGTTALVCAERGIACDTTDINPFLLWLARVKSASYPDAVIGAFAASAEIVGNAIRGSNGADLWLPPIHQIDKWWTPDVLACLGQAMAAIARLSAALPPQAVDLLKIAFCRVMIESANVSFGHQSMSFKQATPAGSSGMEVLLTNWRHAVAVIAAAASSRIETPPRTLACDARELTSLLPKNRYSAVITSPPYPNRMSYIRELRPYMYWLGYLSDARQAGELDWQAIGGTWGVATSNVGKWTPDADSVIPYAEFPAILERIALHSRLLSRYVEKYFHDMLVHCRELLAVVKPGGAIHYIVGNSKFYDVLLPVEAIYAAMFEAAGFVDARVEVVRKRTSKKELFEFLVTARKPI